MDNFQQIGRGWKAKTFYIERNTNDGNVVTENSMSNDMNTKF